jgi:hypothetical protein
VNEAAKTISVTGIKLGSGVLNGLFVGATGGTTTRIQVYVESIPMSLSLKRQE